jgi:gliding motility-associated-like protein
VTFRITGYIYALFLRTRLKYTPQLYMKATGLLIFFVLFFAIRGSAQLCNGSLGDPVINETFGTTRAPLPASKTSFRLAQGCPGRGQYALANLIFGCGEDRSWLMLAGDHTRDQNGHYMLVNAQSSDGAATTAVVYTDTARGLCGSLTYVFSAWVTNALQPISCAGNAVPASLTLQVTTLAGTVLGKVDTGNLPIELDKKWVEYGLSFQIPPGESAVIVTVLTESKAGCGQGFAIDDITVRPCGPEVTATVNGSADPVNVCADFSSDFVLTGAYTPGFTNPSVQWQRSLDTGRTWTTIPAATTLRYVVPRQAEGVILYRMAVGEGGNISSPQCRFVSNVLSTSVHPLPPKQAPQNLLGCIGKDLQLPAMSPFAHENIWTGPNGFTSANQNPIVPEISPAATGLYVRQQDFGLGCFALDSFYVQVHPSTTISAPSVYSVCEGKGVRLEASGEGQFSWQPATGLSSTNVANPIASPRDSTEYKVVLTNSFGCQDSALVMVNVSRNPVASAGPDQTVVKGDTVTLNGVVSGTAVQYQWSPPDYISNVNVLSPKVFPPFDIQYTLTAESMVGCGTTESSVMVRVYDDIFIPNAFSPNNDGKNDRFRVAAAGGYEIVGFGVYNRWGQLIYQSTDASAGWDGRFGGKPQPEGTYIYFLKLRSSSGTIETRKGTVTLIR